ncbi:MAG: hypothetical protein AVO33_09860 [delta proteobacterium ML8_F1]|nr:MAG: hypothetical protein AVO33_09860 [delta proteobacterium ML8_F1]
MENKNLEFYDKIVSEFSGEKYQEVFVKHEMERIKKYSYVNKFLRDSEKCFSNKEKSRFSDKILHNTIGFSKEEKKYSFLGMFVLGLVALYSVYHNELSINYLLAGSCMVAIYQYHRLFLIADRMDRFIGYLYKENNKNSPERIYSELEFSNRMNSLFKKPVFTNSEVQRGDADVFQ